MKYTAIVPLLFFLSHNAVSQFKNTYAANGNPTTQIVDPSGMKQGSWHYYDTSNRIYRSESYTDHVLTKSVYLASGGAVNMMGFQELELQALNKNVADFVTNVLQPLGKGELIFLPDGTVHLHIYVDKLRAGARPEVELGTIQQSGLRSAILKF